MAKQTGPGRRSLFGSKEGGGRVQGELTKIGTASFEWARQQLVHIYTTVFGRSPGRPSDGDTIEYLARGEKATRLYFEKVRQQNQADSVEKVARK